MNMIMENPSILDLDYSTFSEIRNILENPSTMESFLEVLPPDCTTEVVLNSMDIESRRYNMTPAKYLLQNVLGSKDYRVSHLIEWFEAINLEKALVHLKKHEDLRIIEHPCENVQINEGNELLLTCHATSYPPPEYQWFKFSDSLLLQIEPVLKIKQAKKEDGGHYTCLVTKWNAEKNSYDYLYSNPSCVEIVSDLYPVSSLFYNPEPSTHNFWLSRKNLLEVTTKIKDKIVPSSEEAESVPLLPNLVYEHQNNILLKEEIITITKHPYVPKKVDQGMSICLTCEAVSSLPVCYQWFKNGRLLLGENCSKLDLINLYPDPDTGEIQWVYQCAVYNEYDQAFSQTVVVELNDVNHTTPLIAQEKIAFMVANDTYDHLDNLIKPAADVSDVAKMLSSIGFKIMAFKNLTLAEMQKFFSLFCTLLKPGSYAIFFFSGHGFELYGQTYLQPVDCSINALQQESVCSEYILECMQKTKPAMNILLIDACRKLPLVTSEISKLQYIYPGKIFQAKMKNNTIYGYSTSFLCSAHESDNEVNSVFVKHLKKYLTYNKRVEEILMMVQEDCGKDPLIKGLQCPAIKSTLAEPRKLNDPLLQRSSTSQNPPVSNVPSTILNWCDIKRDVNSITLSMPKSSVILEIHHHREVFCNGIDVFVYLYVEPGANLFFLQDIEINITFKSDILCVLPTVGINLKNITLQIEYKTLLFKKEVFNVQKINHQPLEGEVSFKLSSKNNFQNVPFSIDVPISVL